MVLANLTRRDECFGTIKNPNEHSGPLGNEKHKRVRG